MKAVHATVAHAIFAIAIFWSPGPAAAASDVFETLLDGVSSIGNVGAGVRDAVRKVKRTEDKNRKFWTYRISDKALIYREKSGKYAFFLIKGRTSIESMESSGVFAAFGGKTGLDDMIFAVVRTGSDGILKASDLPEELNKLVADKKTYDGKIALGSGFQLFARPKVDGPLAWLLTELNLPTKNEIIMRAGVKIPFVGDSKTGVAKTVKNLKVKLGASLDLIIRGQWREPFGMVKTAVDNTRFYMDTSGKIGFVGNMTIDKDRYLAFFKIPLNLVAGQFQKSHFFNHLNKAKLGIQVGFGAKEIHLGHYYKLMTALSSAKFNIMGPLAKGSKEKAVNAVYDVIDAVPFEALKITNDRMDKYVWAPEAQFPDLDHFNLVVLGPAAKFKRGSKDEVSGPLFRAEGKVVVLGECFGEIALDMSKSGIFAGAEAGIRIGLGRVGSHDLGSIRVKSTFEFQIDDKDAFMKIYGNSELGPIGGREVSLVFDVTRDKVLMFRSPSSCAFPFDLETGVKFVDLGNFKLSGLKLNPNMIVPDTGTIARCAATIYYAARDGAVYAFTKSKELGVITGKAGEAAAKEVGKGLKAAGGKIVDAGEDMAAAVDTLCSNKKLKAGPVCSTFGAAFEDIVEFAEDTGAFFGDSANDVASFASDAAPVFASAFKAIGGLFSSGGSAPLIKTYKWKNKVLDVGRGKAEWIVLADNTVWSGVSGKWKKMDGKMKRIDAGPRGEAWGIGMNDQIYYHGSKDKKWTRFSKTKALDIGVGAGGHVWIVGTDGRVHQKKGNAFVKSGGSVMRSIDVSPTGQIWVIDKSNVLKTAVAGKWRNLPGTAKDITIDSKGRVWKLGTNGKLYEWKYDTYWKPYGGSNGIRMSAGVSEIYVTSKNGWAYKGPLPKYVREPGPRLWRVWLKSASTQACLTNKVHGMVDANAHLSRVTSGKCNTNLKYGDQQFFVRNIDSKDSRKVKFVNARNGLCLGMAFAGKGDNAPLVNMICRKGVHQIWVKHEEKDGKFRLQNAASQKCLKIHPKSTSPYQVKCSKTDTGQRFSVHNIDKTPPRHHTKPDTKVKPRKDWKFAFEVAGAAGHCFDNKSAARNRPGIWKCNRSAEQQFRIGKVSLKKHKLTKTVQILNRHNKCLAASKRYKISGLTKGKAIVRGLAFTNCKANDPRYAWNIDLGASGLFQLRNAGVNECLQLQGNSAKARTPFTIADCKGSKKTAFRFAGAWVK